MTTTVLARLQSSGLDATTLLVLPAAAIIAATFVYPFLYGLVLSFHPKAGGPLANYAQFFADPFLYDTIATTVWLSVPVTLLNVAISVPIALRVRLMRHQRLLTTILVVPNHPRHRPRRPGPAQLSRPARLVQSNPHGHRPHPRPRPPAP